MLARMPGGPKEERLRAWVARRLKRRGVAASLARHLNRPASWVTMYSSGERDADLDTSIAIAQYFDVPLAAVVEGDLPDVEPEIRVDPDLLDAMRDEEMATAVRALQRLAAPLRASMIALLQTQADATGEPEQFAGSTREIQRARSRATRARKDARRP